MHDIDLNAPAEKQADRPDRRTREVQAESIAYAVCQHYGLDTSDYSFSYVAQWSSGRELSELKASLETIRSTASELIKDIDKNFAELTKDKEQLLCGGVQVYVVQLGVCNLMYQRFKVLQFAHTLVNGNALVGL